MEQEPTNADYLVDYAISLGIDNYDMEMAKGILERALEFDPDSEVVYRVLAKWAERDREWDVAVQWWEQAVSVPDSSVDSLLHLAEAYTKVDEYGQAIAAYEIAVARVPESAAIRLILAQNYLIINDWANAIIHANESIERDPEQLDAWLILAKSNYILGDIEQTLFALEQSLTIAPDNEEANALLQTIDSQ